MDKYTPFDREELYLDINNIKKPYYEDEGSLYVDDELVKDDLEELEEKEKEQEKQEEQPVIPVYEEPNKNSLTGTKPKYMIQTIDVDKTYVDDKTTVRRAFKIPEPVQGIAIAKPLEEDENVLATDMTMYMLDGTGRVIEDVDGQTIQDFFEADDATGKNHKTEGEGVAGEQECPGDALSFSQKSKGECTDVNGKTI